MKARYETWDTSNPGITFALSTGRISVFLRTLTLLEYPQYFCFRFCSDLGQFDVRACEKNDEGSRLLRIRAPKEGVTVKNINLVRTVYSVCGWNPGISYRIAGNLRPEDKLVRFDLSSAYEIHEGRLMKNASTMRKEEMVYGK